ncbi:MAG TPA: hypothetical protein VE086_03750, partial [Chthoniobacterales bacterium]|nr:hypothetical protein [Chthoniobacterales bacterium]
RPPTTDLAAFDLYNRAREIWRSLTTSTGSGGSEKFKAMIGLLDQAVSRDPMFVAALCELARAHLYLHWQGVDPAASHLALARKALETAERLQPGAGEVHLARGLYYYQGSRDYPAALGELVLAERSLPNDAVVRFTIALVERRQGRWADSTRHIEEALRWDPRNIQFISELAGTNYYVLRRYAEAVKMIDNALTWNSGDFGLAFLGATLETAWKADLHRWTQVVDGETARNADPNDLATARLRLALKQRDYQTAKQILGAPAGSEFDDDGYFTPRELSRAIVARGLGESEQARKEFEAARVRAAAAVTERPEDARAWIALAEIDAGLKRKDEAIREGEKATSLLPIEKDVLNGNQLRVKLTQIYAQVGEPDRALELLSKVISQPDGSNYGSLMLDEAWDPLRGDPRFEKIVQSLAPK